MLEYHKRHPEVMRRLLDEQFKKMGLPRFQRLRALQYATSRLRLEILSSVMDREQSDYESAFNILGPMLLETIPSITKDSHIKALAKNLIPEPRAEDYRSLHWYVCKSSQPLILGDLGCLFEVTGAKQYITLTGNDDELKAVYLPISSERLIVGTASPIAPHIDFNRINQAFSEHSRDFFICCEHSQQSRDLQKLLGTKAEILSNDEIKEILIEALIND
jgi:hypothetical protein